MLLPPSTLCINGVLPNKEALNILCSVVRHADSSWSTKEECVSLSLDRVL